MSNTVYNTLKVFGSKTGLILFKNWFDNNAPKLIKRYEAIQLMKSNNKELIYNIRTQWNPIYSFLIELTEKFPHLMLILESNSLDNDKTQITIVYQSKILFDINFSLFICSSDNTRHGKFDFMVNWLYFQALRYAKESRQQWSKNIVNHDESYPDPIDNSPCDTCFKVK